MANGHSERCQMPLINAPTWLHWALWQAWFNLLFGNQPHLWTFCSSYKSKSYCWSFGAEHFQNVSLNNHKLLFSPVQEVNISWLLERADYVSWSQQCVLCLTESCCTPSSPPKPPCNLHLGSCSLGAVDNNVIHAVPDSDLITGMTYPPIKGQCYFRWSLFLWFTTSTTKHPKNPQIYLINMQYLGDYFIPSFIFWVKTHYPFDEGKSESLWPFQNVHTQKFSNILNLDWDKIWGQSCHL